MTIWPTHPRKYLFWSILPNLGIGIVTLSHSINRVFAGDLGSILGGVTAVSKSLMMKCFFIYKFLKKVSLCHTVTKTAFASNNAYAKN